MLALRQEVHHLLNVGYRIHITETCEDGLPSIITDVQRAPQARFQTATPPR